jgi:preprotein translocase subunit YajC
MMSYSVMGVLVYYGLGLAFSFFVIYILFYDRDKDREKYHEDMMKKWDEGD